MHHMRQKFSVAVATTLTLVLLGTTAQGQSGPDPAAAEIAFEINMDALRDTPMYKMAQTAIESQPGMVPGNGDVEKIKRVWGAVQLPEKVADIEEAESGEQVPMDLFIRIELEDKKAADEMVAEMIKDSNEIKEDGETFYTPKNGPQNLRARRANDTTLEVATNNFFSKGLGENLYSPGLKKAWGMFSGEPIRIAVDLENARGLVDEGLGMAKDQVEPMMHGMLDMVNKMDNVRIAMDFQDGSNLMALGMTSADEDTAEELRKGLDGLLGLAKMAGGAQVEQLKQVDEGMANTVSAILKSMQANREGDDVQINIPKPEGFDKTLQSMMNMGGVGNDF